MSGAAANTLEESAARAAAMRSGPASTEQALAAELRGGTAESRPPVPNGSTPRPPTQPQPVQQQQAHAGVRPTASVPTGNQFNYRGEPVCAPEGHRFNSLDPPMSRPPKVAPGPFTAAQRAEFLEGRGGHSGLAPHHRHQLPLRDGGVIDEIPRVEHNVSGRHPASSVFNNEAGGSSLRQREIYQHWRAKGLRLVERPPGSGRWLDPGL